MLKIALSGNIGAGKSEVEKIFKEIGIDVIDADEISHQALFEEENKKLLLKEFGKIIFEISGEISRKKLAEIIFTDEKERKKLEQIIHPYIFTKIDEFLTKKSSKPFAIVSMTLLFETNQQNNFDKIIFIKAPEKLRLERILKRGYTKQEAINRIKSQQNQNFKAQNSDYVINNNSSLTELRAKIMRLKSRISQERNG